MDVADDEADDKGDGEVEYKCKDDEDNEERKGCPFTSFSRRIVVASQYETSMVYLSNLGIPTTFNQHSKLTDAVTYL